MKATTLKAILILMVVCSFSAAAAGGKKFSIFTGGYGVVGLDYDFYNEQKQITQSLRGGLGATIQLDFRRYFWPLAQHDSGAAYYGAGVAIPWYPILEFSFLDVGYEYRTGTPFYFGVQLNFHPVILYHLLYDRTPGGSMNFGLLFLFVPNFYLGWEYVF